MNTNRGTLVSHLWLDIRGLAAWKKFMLCLIGKCMPLNIGCHNGRGHVRREGNLPPSISAKESNKWKIWLRHDWVANRSVGCRSASYVSLGTSSRHRGSLRESVTWIIFLCTYSRHTNHTRGIKRQSECRIINLHQRQSTISYVSGRLQGEFFSAIRTCRNIGRLAPQCHAAQHAL